MECICFYIQMTLYTGCALWKEGSFLLEIFPLLALPLAHLQHVGPCSLAISCQDGHLLYHFLSTYTCLTFVQRICFWRFVGTAKSGPLHILLCLQHFHFLLCHPSHQDKVDSLLKASIDALQLLLGSHTIYSQIPIPRYSHFLSILVEFFTKFQGTLTLNNPWLTPLGS